MGVELHGIGSGDGMIDDPPPAPALSSPRRATVSESAYGSATT